MTLAPDLVMRCLRCLRTDSLGIDCVICQFPMILQYLNPEAGCRQCQLKALGGIEQIDVEDKSVGRRFTFNVTLAKEITAGWDSSELPLADCLRFLQTNVTEAAHYAHVDVSLPGIVAQVPVRKANKETQVVITLIDGSHRAARCIREGLVFRARVMNFDVSLSCVMNSVEIGRGQFGDVVIRP